MNSGALFWPVLRFELAYHRRQPLIYIVTVLFFLLAFGGTASEDISIGGSNRNLNLNAPFVVMVTLAVFSMISMFIIVAFAANPILRDFENRTAEFFFTTRVDKFSYLMGRFTGAVIVGYISLLGAILGVWVGEQMPWLDQERVGPTAYGAFWFANWCLLLPNVFIMSSLFFCVATLTRSMFGSYLVAVALIVLNTVISNYTDPDTIRMTSFADPFGLTAFFFETRYWTVFERNTLVPDLSGNLLLNRAAWIAIGIAALALAYWRFPFSLEAKRRCKKKKPDAVQRRAIGPFTAMRPHFDGKTRFKQLVSQTKMDLKTTLLSVPFVVLLVFAMFNMTGGSLGLIGNMFGTDVYPTTGLMIRAIQSGFLFMILIVIIYYSGELVNRDKTLLVSSYVDAMPWPNWIMVVSKVFALFLIVVVMLTAAALTSVVIQLFHSYYNFEFPLYALGLLVFCGIPFYLAAVLAITVQSVVQNKYIGMLVMTLYLISWVALPGAGYRHQLYRLTVDFIPYSDINGFGHFVTRFFWFSVYWGIFAVLLGILAHLTWNRGAAQSVSARLKLAAERFTQPVMITSTVALLAFTGVGGWIYYNTNVINTYLVNDDLEERSARYEKQYKQYQYIAQPQILGIQADVDIFPAARDVQARGSYSLQNQSDTPISDVHVLLASGLTVNTMTLNGASLHEKDDQLEYRIYRFAAPMQPGETSTLSFDVSWLNDGFRNHGSSTRVVDNGTFFNNTEIFPVIGYSAAWELNDNSTRRKYDLPKVQRAPTIDDPEGILRNQLGPFNRIQFDTTVSTSIEQIAIAPGYLEKEWTEGKRRYFKYTMDDTIWPFFAYISQDYKVRRDVWEREDHHPVNIEVFYSHEVNVDTMIRATRNSLDYFTENFSPYQYRQFRILEFPGYATFAQSFPNTIPYSEAIGFTADLRDPEEIDYVYYVTAHELAHQWWAHQVIGADTQGSAVLTETLSQYSALMAMEQAYGKDHMQRFLKFELDSYLSGRGGELIEELPIRLVENQPYIHYRKGSLVMYALKDLIGEDAINRALRGLIKDFGFKEAPYPTTTDLLAYLRAETPEEYQDTITDLFEKIILYDLQATEVGMTELEDGKYQVDITISARKFEANGAGEETEVPMQGYFDIAVLGEEQGDSKIPELLYLERVEVSENERTFQIEVDSKPVKAGIDPYHKQIDRTPDDNLKTF